MPVMVQIENLHFAYDKQEILCGVNLDVRADDFIAFVGANGSGKSTLLKIILGFLKPQMGTVQVQAKCVGYVPQCGLLSVSSFPANVLEVVMLRLGGNTVFSLRKKENIKKAMAALEIVGMRDKAHDLIAELSGGQLQRVLIARELAANPDLIVLDEPTMGLDEKSIRGLFELLKRLNDQGVTILVVNHDLEEVKPYANRIVRFQNKACAEVTDADLSI